MALSPQQERVAELLAAGCSPSEVRSATGFSESYISQLQGNTEFQEAVVLLAGDRLERDIAVRDAYDAVEGEILAGIKERISLADISELSRALDVVAKNNPKRGKGVLNSQGEGAASSISVSVMLPEHVLAPLEVVTNSRNEVVKIGDKSLLPLTTQALQSKLKSMNGTDL